MVSFEGKLCERRSSGSANVFRLLSLRWAQYERFILSKDEESYCCCGLIVDEFLAFIDDVKDFSRLKDGS
jgi:hypothetical protein